MDPIRPAEAHRVTVFGSTLNINATSPGVSSRCSWFSTIMISSSGLNSPVGDAARCVAAGHSTRHGPRLLSVC
jgi:hypothetical protein